MGFYILAIPIVLDFIGRPLIFLIIFLFLAIVTRRKHRNLKCPETPNSIDGRLHRTSLWMRERRRRRYGLFISKQHGGRRYRLPTSRQRRHTWSTCRRQLRDTRLYAPKLQTTSLFSPNLRETPLYAKNHYRSQAHRKRCYVRSTLRRRDYRDRN